MIIPLGAAATTCRNLPSARLRFARSTSRPTIRRASAMQRTTAPMIRHL